MTVNTESSTRFITDNQLSLLDNQLINYYSIGANLQASMQIILQIIYCQVRTEVTNGDNIQKRN